MESLPPEIIHIIFAHSKPQDLTNARLVCKKVAQIGLHHLLRSYHLIFERRSFERLLEIAQHPIARRYVESIYYEADQLVEHDSQEDWEWDIYIKEVPHKLKSNPPLRTDSHRDRQEYDLWYEAQQYTKGLQPFPPSVYTKQQLDDGYAIYNQYMTDQATMRANDCNARLISDAMRGLPNLKSLSMSMKCGLDIRSDYIVRAFIHTLQKPYGERTTPDSCGAAQLCSLLLGAQDNALRIKDLCCGRVNWRFFRQDREIFSKLRKATRFLQTLEMHITAETAFDLGGEDWEYDAPIEECASFIESGPLREFTTAAPDLKDLIVKFDTECSQMAARLVDIVGSFQWKFLRRAHFGYISSTPQDLIAFYERHCETLKDVGIDSCKLDKGAWGSVFQKMAEMLRLDKVAITGYLHDSLAERIVFGRPNDIACTHPKRIRSNIENYLLNSKGEDDWLDSEELNDWLYDDIAFEYW